MKVSVLPAMLLLVLLVGGCAHSAGYTAIHTRQTPLGGEVIVEESPWGKPFNVVKDLTSANPILVVRIEQTRVLHGFVRQETFGRKVYVPWKPYAPFVKIVGSATVVFPIYFAWYDPTPHGLKNWGMTDFLWDFASWYNWFSAIPNDSRQVESTERLLRTREVMGALSEEIVGAEGREVELHLADKRVATQISDAEGYVRFDVGALLTPELAAEDRPIRLQSPRPEGPVAETSWTLSAFTIRQLLEQREAEERIEE